MPGLHRVICVRAVAALDSLHKFAMLPFLLTVSCFTHIATRSQNKLVKSQCLGVSPSWRVSCLVAEGASRPFRRQELVALHLVHLTRLQRAKSRNLCDI